MPKGVIRDVENNAYLHAQFRRFVKRIDMTRILACVKGELEPQQAYAMLANPTSAEKTILRGLEKRAMKIYKTEWGHNGGSRHASPTMLHRVVLRTQDWKDCYNEIRKTLHLRLDKFLNNEFYLSKEYDIYISTQVKGTTLAKELELDAEPRSVAEMATALIKGDQNKANRLSQSIADSHKPRRGKKMAPKELMKAVWRALPSQVRRSKS